MRPAFVALLLCVFAPPVMADAKVKMLTDVLRISEVIQILQQEGIDHGVELDQTMLNGQGGAFWSGQINRIYDANRMQEVLRRALETGLTDQDVESSLAYFSREDSQRIITLENEARRMIADPEVEQHARRNYEATSGSDDQLLSNVTEFISVNDLLERNVASALTSSFQFYRGLSDGGYYKRSEADILQEVWADQDAIRDDTQSWLFGFFLMAYQPLEAERLRDYIAFSKSPAGRNLNAALFDGFGTMYNDISYALGRAVALNVQGDEI